MSQDFVWRLAGLSENGDIPHADASAGDASLAAAHVGRTGDVLFWLANGRRAHTRILVDLRGRGQTDLHLYHKTAKLLWNSLKARPFLDKAIYVIGGPNYPIIRRGDLC